MGEFWRADCQTSRHCICDTGFLFECLLLLFYPDSEFMMVHPEKHSKRHRFINIERVDICEKRITT